MDVIKTRSSTIAYDAQNRLELNTDPDNALDVDGEVVTKIVEVLQTYSVSHIAGANYDWTYSGEGVLLTQWVMIFMWMFLNYPLVRIYYQSR